jgi:hypothetical protein
MDLEETKTTSDFASEDQQKFNWPTNLLFPTTYLTENDKYYNEIYSIQE